MLNNLETLNMPQYKNLSEEYIPMVNLFCDKFKEICDKYIQEIECNKLCGVITIKFKDGTSCGSNVPWKKSGFNVY